MQKSITSKALSLFLALAMAMTMSVTAFAAGTITPTPSAAIDLNTQVGTAAVTGGYSANDFDVEVTLTVDDAVTGLTVTLKDDADDDSFALTKDSLNTEVATAGNTKFKVKPVDNNLTDTGSADGDGVYTATILVNCAEVAEQEITVKFTVTAAGGTPPPSATTYANIAPSPVSTNGVTATVTFSPASPQEAGAAVTATVTLTGTATAAGNLTIDLTSSKASLATSVKTKNVAAGEAMNSATFAFPFTMPGQNADDFALTLNFVPGGTPPVVNPPVVNPPVVNPPVNPNSNSGSSSGGSSGGGSSAPAEPAKSANVSADGSVSATTVTNELKQALNAAPATGTAVVSVKNADSITASAINSLAKAAAAAGKAAVVHADTVGTDGKIQGRLYIDPAKLAGMSGSLKLGVATQGTRPESRKSLFEKYFNNKVSVISFGQQGGFGATLKVAAKVTLPANTDALTFYSYDAQTNSFKKIDTAYRIDKNGFIHFETALGGDIIIADKPLAKK